MAKMPTKSGFTVSADIAMGTPEFRRLTAPETPALQKIWLFRGVEVHYGERYYMWEHFATGRLWAWRVERYIKESRFPGLIYHAKHMAENSIWQWDCDMCNPVTPALSGDWSRNGQVI